MWQIVATAPKISSCGILQNSVEKIHFDQHVCGVNNQGGMA